MNKCIHEVHICIKAYPALCVYDHIDTREHALKHASHTRAAQVECTFQVRRQHLNDEVDHDLASMDRLPFQSKHRGPLGRGATKWQTNLEHIIFFDIF